MPSLRLSKNGMGGANLMLLVPFDNVLPDFESGSIEYKDILSDKQSPSTYLYISADLSEVAPRGIAD